MKKYILKTTLFITIALAINIVVQYLMARDRETVFFELREKLAEKHDCIFFGSSVNTHHEEYWNDKRTISEMLDSLCPTITITGISRTSASIENYYNYLRYAIKQNNIPKKVIIPINVRAFTYEWGKRPEYIALIARERIFLDHGIIPYIFRKIIPRFSKEINRQSHSKFYEEPVIINGEQKGKVKEYIVEDRSSIQDTVKHYTESFRFLYMSDILETESKITYLKALDSLCGQHGITPIYYLTPIDYQSGNNYLGSQFSDKLKKQVQFFEKILKKDDNTILIDLTFALDSSHFNYYLLPNEHLMISGKKFIAEQISKQINEDISNKHANSSKH